MRNSRDSLEEVQHLLRGAPEDYDDDGYTQREIPLTQSSKRWCAVVGYFLSASSASILMSSTWLLSGTIQKIYGKDQFIIQLFTYVFFLAPLIMTIPASYVISYHSLTTSLTIGVLCSSVGAWLRSFISDNFSLAFAGQCLAALGVSFFYNAPSHISAKWYYPQNRTTATLILTLCPLVFSFITPSLSTFVVNHSPSSITQDLYPHYRQLMSVYFKFQAIFVTLTGCLGMLLFQEQPRIPPSHSEKAERESFLKSFQIFTNCSYLLSICAAGIAVGSFNAMTVFSEQLLLQRGLARNQISLVYLIYIPLAVGITLFCGFISKFLEKPKFLLLVSQTGLLLVMLLMLAYYNSQNSTVFIILLVIQAALAAPVTGLTIETVADFTFPVGEAFSAGFVVGSISLFSLLFSLLLNPFISTKKEQLVFVVFVLTQGLAILSSLFTKECPRRLADNNDFILFNKKEEYNGNSGNQLDEQEEEEHPA